MIQHVFERAAACSDLDHLLIATDSPEIQSKVQQFGADVCMTSSEHETGLDRIIEVKKKIQSTAFLSIYKVMNL